MHEMTRGMAVLTLDADPNNPLKRDNEEPNSPDESDPKQPHGPSSATNPNNIKHDNEEPNSPDESDPKQPRGPSSATNPNNIKHDSPADDAAANGPKPKRTAAQRRATHDAEVAAENAALKREYAAATAAEAIAVQLREEANRAERAANEMASDARRHKRSAIINHIRTLRQQLRYEITNGTVASVRAALAASRANVAALTDEDMNHVITDEPEHVPFTNDFRDNLATMAARRGEIGKTLALLEAAGVSDASNGNGQTVLHIACVIGSVELAKALFEQPPRARDERGGWRGPAYVGSSPNLTDATGYTPLMIAAARRDVAMVDLFMRYARDYIDSHPVADGQPPRVVCNLSTYVDVRGSMYYGRTALHIVCALIPEYSPTPWTGDGPDTRSVEIIRALCTHDHKVANYIADAKRLPLEVACLAGRVVDAVSLITCGANPFLAIDNQHGRATLEEAITTVAGGAATSSGARLFEVYSEWARTTPEWSSARKWITKYDKETAETAAALATSGSAEDIARALADLPQMRRLLGSIQNTTDLYYSLFYQNGLALINAEIYSEYSGMVGTILGHAARNTDFKVVRALIANGADVNLASTSTSHTPLMNAAYNRRSVVIIDLIRAGANANAVRNNGRTALYDAVDQYNGRGQRVAIETEFVDEHNAGREIADDDDAISVECIRSLCAAGAEVDAALTVVHNEYTGETSRAQTPFTLAVNHGDVVIIKALLECGANPLQNIVLERVHARERYEEVIAHVVADMGGLEGVKDLHMQWIIALPETSAAVEINSRRIAALKADNAERKKYEKWFESLPDLDPRRLQYQRLLVGPGLGRGTKGPPRVNPQ